MRYRPALQHSVGRYGCERAGLRCGLSPAVYVRCIARCLVGRRHGYLDF
jgi:hypothetical protein